MTPRRGRVLALLLLSVVLGPLAPAAYASSPVPAATVVPAAATDTSTLALGAITPPVAGPGVTVTVTGSVVARTARLADPTVRVVLGATTVVSRASVEA